jgi:hypothetical protein
MMTFARSFLTEVIGQLFLSDLLARLVTLAYRSCRLPGQKVPNRRQRACHQDDDKYHCLRASFEPESAIT